MLKGHIRSNIVIFSYLNDIPLQKCDIIFEKVLDLM